MNHHKVFSNFKCWNGMCKSSYVMNFLGVRTKKEYLCPVDPSRAFPVDPNHVFDKDISDEIDEYIQTEYPSFSEGYFEWISVLESVINAKNKLTVIELGAGIGPHLVNAATAARLYHGKDFLLRLVGVEGEPTCFKWLQEHFKDNDINPKTHQLIEAVVNEKGREVLFEVGFPKGYGSRVVTPYQYVFNMIRELYRMLRRTYKKMTGQKCLLTDYWTGEKGLGIHYQKVKGTTLNAILESLDEVDLIHIDIQGEEYEVLMSSNKNICEKVKKLHIGTHPAHHPGIEDKLRKLFKNLGWRCIHDYSGGGERHTPYGTIRFYDGVQVWTNPRK